jgi:hypothetical protein
MASYSGGRRDQGKGRRGRGFAQAARAASPLLGGVGVKRGFAERRLITEWRSIVGEELARACRPLKMQFRRGDGALGATLIVAAEGARAVEAQHLSDRIVERVNQVYGYRAVARLKVVQAARAGVEADALAEPAAAFTPPPVDPRPSPLISGVEDDSLRAALARLEANIGRRSQD